MVNQYPALFGLENEFGGPLPLIVVGAADKYGGRREFSQQNLRLLTTYAQGDDIRCPAATGNGLRGENVTPPKYPEGTSFGEFILDLILRLFNFQLGQMLILCSGSCSRWSCGIFLVSRRIPTRNR